MRKDYLLRPHSGEISIVATELKGHLHGVLDLTLVYPDDKSTFYDLMKGDVETHETMGGRKMAIERGNSKIGFWI